jgi:glycosyltransferase involved in cell wall biosynthesis
VGDGFVPIEWFNKTGKPVVWTMHDMWPFTGGCHYAADCVRYRGTCGLCPQLGSRRLRDLSFRSVQRKHRAWALFPGALVSPSRWLAEAARESSTFRNNTVQVIPNGLDRGEARRQLGIPENERIVLAGAMGTVKDPRKGFSLLAEALRKCSPSDRIAPWRLLVFGADAGPGEDVLGIPVAYRGHIRSEQDLPAFYRAADVYALPSLQDNLPNTVVEALACGTPVVGFRASGLGTMIDDGQTGWLAEPFSTGSLASALKKVLSTSESLRHTCRAQFEREYAWPGPAHQYMALYNALLSRQLGVPITKHSSSQAGD